MDCNFLFTEVNPMPNTTDQGGDPLGLKLWLENFVYRTPLSVGVFVGAIFLIGMIAVITVAYETTKAAVANPVKALKHE